MKKVLIVGSRGTCQYAQMYLAAGFAITQAIEKADLVQFTGGADVSPSMYGEQPHPQTQSSRARDEEEHEVYQAALALGKPMVGICRGGQFLNVMNGGKMYQHVDNHAIYGTHEAVDVETDKVVQVTSTHHQMMRPAENAIILCVAELTTSKEFMYGDEIDEANGDGLADFESVWYADTECLCFQPHPEFNRLEIGDTRKYFFELLNRYIVGE